MGDYNDLRHLQGQANLDSKRGATLGMGGGLERTKAGDVGTHHQWSLLVYWLITMGIGLFLFYTPWAPGLGMLILLVAVVGSVPLGIRAWMGK